MSVSAIHGKNDHQETIGTKSFAGNYIVVRNMAEVSRSPENIGKT